MSFPTAFNANGVLPIGTHPTTFNDLRGSFLVVGPAIDPSPNWDVERRRRLVDNAEILVSQLWSVGITEVCLDGSFTEDKDSPNDIDGYFEVDARRLATGDLERDLNALDPFRVWTWDPAQRRADRNSTKKQLPMWHRYRVELYPHYPGLIALKDEWGNELQFPSAFRQQRSTAIRKGIVKVIP